MPVTWFIYHTPFPSLAGHGNVPIGREDLLFPEAQCRVRGSRGSQHFVAGWRQRLPQHLLQFFLHSGGQTPCQMHFSYTSRINLAVPCLNSSYLVTVPLLASFRLLDNSLSLE